MPFRWPWRRRPALSSFYAKTTPVTVDPPEPSNGLDADERARILSGLEAAERMRSTKTGWRAHPGPVTFNPNRREDTMPDETHDPHAEGWNDGEPGGAMDRMPAHRADGSPDDAPTEVIDRRAADCPHCMGTGHTLNTNDYLRMSIGLLGDQGDKAVTEFYTRLLTEAPELASLFPADLTDPLAGATSEGRLQRDRLLGALVAVSQTYDRDDVSAMEILDTHLATFGRSHANFQRPDGSVRGATLAEYHAVKVVLFGTLHDVAGEDWRPEFDDAWSEAFDYAVGEMLHAQNHTDQRSARYPRPSR